MKCPKCGEELRMSQKQPGYALCDQCRKKFRIPETAKAKTVPSTKPVKAAKEEEEHYPKYANIPPKAVREKRENEMRRAYDELLAIGEEERKPRFSFFRRSR